MDTNSHDQTEMAHSLVLINSGIHQHGLHPITSKKIYERLVIPRGLYGCELWNDLNTNELLFLERSHRYCVKLLQGLPRRTNTDVCNSLIGIHSLESVIDRNKLRFFGQLCMLPGTKLVKIVFLNRLTSYCNDPVQCADLFLISSGLLQNMVWIIYCGRLSIRAGFRQNMRGNKLWTNRYLNTNPVIGSSGCNPPITYATFYSFITRFPRLSYGHWVWRITHYWTSAVRPCIY